MSTRHRPSDSGSSSHGHRHGHPDPGRDLTPADRLRHRRALRIMIVVLIPLLVWTLVGLIALWPRDAASHINTNNATANIPGVTYPTGRITNIAAMSCEGMAGSTPGEESGTCANLTVEVLKGDERGRSVEVQLTDAVYASGIAVGQQVKLIRVPAGDGQPAYYQFADFERRTPLIVIALLFAVAVVVVARWRGFASLVGLGFAAFILVAFMFPALISGSNPVLVALVGSSAIMVVVLYAAHGFSARTTTALLGTQFGLLLSAGLGWFATRWAHLTGVTAEDDYVLAGAAPDLSLTSVVVVGIIIAGLGVLNDVTITQASAVWELADTDPDSPRLFSRAMRIGRDHIASTVYTIAFATAGAVLPVLLLIVIYERPIFEVLQTEQFAGELIRTMVGSIGLVLAVPLTTAIGVAVVRATGTGGGQLFPLVRRAPAALVAGGADDDRTDPRGDAHPVAGTGTDPLDVPVDPAPGRRARRAAPDSDSDLDFSDLRDPDDPRDADPHR